MILDWAKFYRDLSNINERKLGSDIESRKSQISHYSDTAHFVFELLQNADDYQASYVCFELYEDRLVVEHDGRPFEVANVESISKFESSTSEKDLQKTGRFGLGFKSVLLYTATPCIHSGSFSFMIYDLYRVKGIDRPKDLGQKITRFIFPFNHMEMGASYIYEENRKSQEQARREISDKLSKIERSVLLFTKHVEQISYTIDGGKHALSKETVVLAEDDNNMQTKVSIDDGLRQSYWVFSRRFLPENSLDKETKISVDIAFKTTPNGAVVSLGKASYLFVLFKTIIELKAGFIVNAPFRTPPNRESIYFNNSHNDYIIENLLLLFETVLGVMKNEKRITFDLLRLLPFGDISAYEEDNVNMLVTRPLQEKLAEIVLNEPLLPSVDGDLCNLQHSVIISKRLAFVFSPVQIKTLFSLEFIPAFLASEIEHDTNRDIIAFIKRRYRGNFEIVELEKILTRVDVTFLSEQSAGWLCDFYYLLSENPGLWRDPSTKKYIFQRPLIKIAGNKFLSLHDEKGAFQIFAPSSDVNPNWPVVDMDIYNNKKARAFFDAIGLRQSNLYQIASDNITRRYGASDTKIAYDTYVKDLDLWMAVLQSGLDSSRRTQLENSLSSNWTALAKSIDGTTATYLRPGEIYSDSLKQYMIDAGAKDVFFLDERLQGSIKHRDNDSMTAGQFFSSLGVRNAPRFLSEKYIPVSEPGVIDIHSDLKETFYPEYFEAYLSKKAKDKLDIDCVLMILSAYIPLFQQLICTGPFYGFFTSKDNHGARIPIRFIKELRAAVWMPTKMNTFVSPHDQYWEDIGIPPVL